MDPNPSSKLEAALEAAGVYQDELVRIAHPYYFVKHGLNIQKEPLRYILYEIIEGEFRPGTTQEVPSPLEARRHFKTQLKYDARFFIHPIDYRMLGNMHVVIFPVVMTDFYGCWVDKFTNGATDYQVKEDEILKIFKKIGKNMKYLCSEAELHRPHGNLCDGTGVTPDCEALFYNLGDNGADTMLYSKDIKDLHLMLKQVEPKLQDLTIKSIVSKWMNFLSDTCVPGIPSSSVLPNSSIYPPYQNHDHVRLIFNYPTSWSIDEQLRFLANMYKLCRENDKFNNATKLHQNRAFIGHLAKCGYDRWNVCFTTGKNKSALSEVYNFGANIGIYPFGRSITSTIVLFAHNCIKHYATSAEKYNAKNNHLRGHAGYVLPLEDESEILAEVLKEFPHLIENIYEAFYIAVARGYRHPRFSVEKILTRRI